MLRSDGEHFVSFATDDGLAHNTVGAIHEDFQGGVWFGSEDGSLSRYDRHGIVNLGGREGLQADRVAALATSSDGGVWIGTEQGLRHRRDGEFAILGRRRMPIGTLATFGSGVWVGVSGVEGKGGVWRYGESGLHSVAQGGAYQFQDMVNDLFLDDGGKLWVGTEGGVLALDGDRSESFTERQGLILDQVQAVGQDLAGLLYFGTSGRGVSVYDGLSFTVLTTADGLTDDHVTAIHTDPEGDLWFGTQGGLSRYDGSRFVNYTTRNGLPHNRVEDILTDGSGRRWIATHGGGLAVFDGSTWTAVDSRDGLGDNRINSLAVDGDGGLWLGTESGLTHYVPNETAPRVRLLNVRTDTLYHDPSAVSEVEAGTRITLAYTAIDFETLPAKRRYRFRVAGIDSPGDR